jgi:hypothetical protein
VEGELWLDTDEGRKAFRLLKSGAVREWSFADNNTVDSRRASDGANELVELAVPALTKTQDDALQRSLRVVPNVLGNLGSDVPSPSPCRLSLTGGV